jgi:hypothetical protein
LDHVIAQNVASASLLQLAPACLWARKHTRPNDVILFSLLHRPDMINNRNNPVPAYHSERPSFVWSRTRSKEASSVPLAHAHFAIVTRPQPEPEGLLAIVTRLHRATPP